MITFGLTGGIACGKSTATKTFRANNIPIIDADIVAREVVKPGTKGLSLIIDYFGPDYLLPDGSLNRNKLASLVFADKTSLNKINTIMSPLIDEESSRQIEMAHRDGYLVVGYDAALICEMGLAERYRPLIVVSCPRDTQVARLMARNNLTREQAMARITAQMSVEEKVKLADYVIDTSGTIDSSIKQTLNIIYKLSNKIIQSL